MDVSKILVEVEGKKYSLVEVVEPVAEPVAGVAPEAPVEAEVVASATE